MIFMFMFLLFSVTCGNHVHHTTDQSYEAEENLNITVQWRFSSKGNISVPSLKVHCLLLSGMKVFFHLDASYEEPQHEQFAGRVLCDMDALGAGLVRLHLSRVRTEDSGQYLCRMATGFGRKANEFWLHIAAAVDEPKPVLLPLQPTARHRILLVPVLVLVLLGAAAAVLVGRRWWPPYSALSTGRTSERRREVPTHVLC